MVDTRYDAPHIPAFTGGLIRMKESAKYEGKENFALPYYRRPKQKPPKEEEKEDDPPKDGDHQVDFVA